jgi:DNA mismatch repair ATPase MutS
VAPLFVFIALKMILTRPSRKRVAAVIRGVEIPFRQLDVLADTLEFIEQATFTTARAQQIRTGMMSHGILPSRAIGRLKRLVDMLDWRRNAFFAPISAALSWPLHLAAAIEGWRREFGPKVSAWLDAVAEYEVLSSLAAYSYEHPADPFPDFVEDQTARLEGLQLGHPLVPTARMVRNDVHLTPEVSVLIVSGSNMSGKSTLLRTVGINAVMALAGAPVRAASLRLSPLAIGATLRIQDSLLDGRSRFYAEITRIRTLADIAAGPVPTLFLLDELFHGTNSHDRVLGAQGVLRSLLDRGALGLITTHDLALTAMPEKLAARAVNVHFEDWFEEGGIAFDYRMRPGPVTRSNALALMRAVGLEIANPTPL